VTRRGKRQGAHREAHAAGPKGAKSDARAAEPRGAKRARAVREEISAGGVVFRRTGADTLFLIIRDSYENWGFPKGHLKDGEPPERAAIREVSEETGLLALELRAAIEVIDWHFRFRGRLIHKVCHFFLMETAESVTKPQRAEGITACRWAPYDEALRLISYENARTVLARSRVVLNVEDADPGDAASP
jgi:8-oxo-dGTP pyrophosphatase MutT (NUDIX family)